MVRPQYELRFAADLNGAGIARFLPLTRVRRSRLDRGKPRATWHVAPLFPQYLFVNTPTTDRPDTVARSIASPKFIDVIDQPRLAHELQNLERALDHDHLLEAHPTIHEGQLVRIVEGPFVGTQGIALSRDDQQCQVQLAIEVLGQAVPVTIPVSMIEAC